MKNLQKEPEIAGSTHPFMESTWITVAELNLLG